MSERPASPEPPRRVAAGPQPTRRQALRGGVTTAGATLAVAGIPLLGSVRAAMAQADDDGEIVAGLMALEQTAVVAYGAAAKSGVLDRRAERAVTLFRGQEREHADALARALRDLGRKAPAPPRAGDIVSLRAAKSRREVLEFAAKLETTALAAYHDACQKLDDSRLVQTCGTIMASEGQHLVVLRQALRERPVPNAFETGRER